MSSQSPSNLPCYSSPCYAAVLWYLAMLQFCDTFAMLQFCDTWSQSRQAARGQQEPQRVGSLSISLDATETRVSSCCSAPCPTQRTKWCQGNWMSTCWRQCLSEHCRASVWCLRARAKVSLSEKCALIGQHLGAYVLWMKNLRCHFWTLPLYGGIV